MVVVVEGGITVGNTTTNQNTRHVNVALARRSIYTLNYRGRRYTLTCTEVVIPLIAAGRGGKGRYTLTCLHGGRYTLTELGKGVTDPCV